MKKWLLVGVGVPALAIVLAATHFTRGVSLVGGPGRTPQAQPPITSLDASLDELRRQFNEAADRTRLLLMLSPT